MIVKTKDPGLFDLRSLIKSKVNSGNLESSQILQKIQI